MKATGITKAFAGVAALQQASLSLEAGHIHALVGENGAGKSTLLKIMAGIIRPDAGAVTLGGQPVYENPEAKRRVLFVPTECHLLPGWRQAELVGFYEGVYPRFDRARFAQALGDAPIGGKRVRRLSTGMRMTLAVALALGARPDVLLLDEPFAGLDVIVRRRLIGMLIDECAERPTAVLISSHNVDELERLCDTATFLSRGRVVSSGALGDVKQGAVKRLQVVFAGDPPADLAGWPGIIAVESLGRVHTITAASGDDSIKPRLEACGLVMCEPLPVTLEEAFLFSYKQGGKAV